MNRSNPTEPLPPEERTVSGKVVILAILFLGIAGVVGSQFYHSSLQRRPVELWGQSVAQMMFNSPQVKALRLGTTEEQVTGDAIESLRVSGERVRILEQRDVSQVPGLRSLRHSLINDGGFDWDAPTDDCRPTWIFGLEFTGDPSGATLLFAPDCRRAVLVETGATVVVNAKLMKGIERFMGEQFEKREEKKE